MSKTIAIIAAYDTKGAEAGYVAEQIRRRGHRVLTIDVGTLADTPGVDVTPHEVAAAGGASLAALRAEGDKGKAMAAMAAGAAAIGEKLFREGRFDAILGLGGTAGTATGTAAMRALPVGVPKVMVSTVASGDTSPYVGTRDVTMIYSVVDVAGLNSISRTILANAAGAVSGIAETVVEKGESDRPTIAASMFGNTTACVDRARAALEAMGYEVLVFHATGSGGHTMEELVREGHIDAVLDLTTTELADDLCGGVFSAGPTRLEAAAARGVPQVVAPGCLDMVNFWAVGTVPEAYRQRRLYEWNPNVTLMRTTPEENATLGRSMAEKLNAAGGEVTVLLPLGGVSQLDSEGGAYWWPEADAALFQAIRDTLDPRIRLVELEANINDPAFAERAVAELARMMQAAERTPAPADQS
jgi:uncharacterized protein (UPF0261 family)